MKRYPIKLPPNVNDRPTVYVNGRRLVPHIPSPFGDFVGDYRIEDGVLQMEWVLRNGDLIQVTDDHSYIWAGIHRGQRYTGEVEYLDPAGNYCTTFLTDSVTDWYRVDLQVEQESLTLKAKLWSLNVAGG